MRPDLLKDLLRALNERELPPITDLGSEGKDGTRIDVPRLTRATLRVHDTVLRAVLEDAAKRRRDLEDYAGRVIDAKSELETRCAELETRCAELERAPALPAPAPAAPVAAPPVHRGLAIAGATLVSGLSVWLVLLTAFVCWLAVTR